MYQYNNKHIYIDGYKKKNTLKDRQMNIKKEKQIDNEL